MTVRVIALGNPMASDDGAALRAAQALEGDPGVEVILAGRPGSGLLDLLDASVPTVLLDIVRLGAGAGSVIEVPLADVVDAAIDGRPLSSHGFGAAQALRLARALGRPLPRGVFLGIGGRSFDPGPEPSAEVLAGIEPLVMAARAAIVVLQEES